MLQAAELKIFPVLERREVRNAFIHVSLHKGQVLKGHWHHHLEHLLMWEIRNFDFLSWAAPNQIVPFLKRFHGPKENIKKSFESYTQSRCSIFRTSLSTR